jgi:hypothetical protein
VNFYKSFAKQALLVVVVSFLMMVSCSILISVLDTDGAGERFVIRPALDPELSVGADMAADEETCTAYGSFITSSREGNTDRSLVVNTLLIFVADAEDVTSDEIGLAFLEKFFRHCDERSYMTAEDYEWIRKSLYDYEPG